MNITGSQKEIAQMILDGMSFADITRKLGVSNIAVGARLRAIRARTGCHDRYDFFVHADALGLQRPFDDELIVAKSLLKPKGVAPCNTEPPSKA